MKIKITNFALRHFNKDYDGTKILDFTPRDFEQSINNILNDRFTNSQLETPGKYQSDLSPTTIHVNKGYADFVKLISIQNFTTAKVGSLPITIENYQYLRSGYVARTPFELPVLTRWFELPIPQQIANWLVLVLYSKEQIEKESKGKNDSTEMFGFDADYGIVCILGQDKPYPEPMEPITMMRNALGILEGGSGVSLNRKEYQASVNFWQNRAKVK